MEKFVQSIHFYLHRGKKYSLLARLYAKKVAKPVGLALLFSGVAFVRSISAESPPLPKVVVDGNVTYKLPAENSNPGVLIETVEVELYPEDRLESGLIDREFMRFGVGQRVTVHRAPRIKLHIEGQDFAVGSWTTSVEEFLFEKGIWLSGEDYVVPAADTAIRDGDEIKVYRVAEYKETRREVTEYQTSSSHKNTVINATNCATHITQQGQAGVKDVEYLVREEDGIETRRTTLAVNVLQQLRNHVVEKDRFISPNTESGAANWVSPTVYPRESGYYTAYKGFGTNRNVYYGKKILVRNNVNGRQIVVKVVDYGPHAKLLDLSRQAYNALGGSPSLNNLHNVSVQKILCEA